MAKNGGPVTKTIPPRVAQQSPRTAAQEDETTIMRNYVEEHDQSANLPNDEMARAHHKNTSPRGFVPPSNSTEQVRYRCYTARFCLRHLSHLEVNGRNY